MNDAESNALRERIESLEQQQELLLYTVTHDLRTPVMTVLGFADLLLADWQNHAHPPQSRQYLERIRSAAHRQSQMIQDLQTLAQLPQEALPTQLVDLSDVARERLRAMMNADSNVIVNIHPTSSIICDATSIQIVLNALMANALKLSGVAQQPMIEFGAAPDDAQRCFYVRSNGSGFDLGPDQSLLTLFRRLQSSADLAGSGIALLTAFMMIYQQRGKLWINTNPEHGTTIYFSLPK